jgi:hypothetical protein
LGRHAISSLTMLLLPPSLFYYISLSKEKEIVIGEGRVCLPPLPRQMTPKVM